ncbi:hypothetical protein QQM39_44135 [Streptomyces sp. DT2A-34]|uniref:hypothetical protein n=1 Tax=Streptomyces sp. DT2A-34 TaxID=3051182 RepID=UPI00265B8C75|nr:hypothetical protein [Streptomyces sp. DT2A-34]MDO0917534.1 hypothetical protein [Streptomyces sp. DT2A-34]
MPITWGLANPKIEEREVPAAMLDREPHLAADRPGLLLIADGDFASKEFETDLAFQDAELLCPSFRREKRRTGESLLKSVRQSIESVNDTVKGRLDLEQHGGPSRASPSASPGASSRWPRLSGTATRPARRSCGR